MSDRASHRPRGIALGGIAGAPQALPGAVHSGRGRARIPVPLRRIGSPLLWSPMPEEEVVMRRDFEELMEMVCLGEVERISAHYGTYLQIRPRPPTRGRARRVSAPMAAPSRPCRAGSICARRSRPGSCAATSSCREDNPHGAVVSDQAPPAATIAPYVTCNVRLWSEIAVSTCRRQPGNYGLPPGIGFNEHGLREAARHLRRSPDLERCNHVADRHNVRFSMFSDCQYAGLVARH